MPSAVSLGWRLRTVTLAPASPSRCATGRPSVPVPPVTRIGAVMTSPSPIGRNGLDYRLHGHRPGQRPYGRTSPLLIATCDGHALLHVRYPFSSTCQTVVTRKYPDVLLVPWCMVQP